MTVYETYILNKIKDKLPEVSDELLLVIDQLVHAELKHRGYDVDKD